MAAVVDAESGTGAPAVELHHLPALPRPDRASLCCQRFCGTFAVSLIISIFVGTTLLITWNSDRTAAKVGKAFILLETVLAYACLFALQYGDFGTVRRGPKTSLPMPDIIVQRVHRELGLAPTTSPMAAYQKAVNGLGNIRDDEGAEAGTIYCVRCFVWRRADGHHCSCCQRCVNDFDHHCGVLGCCVYGRGFEGNMWLFNSLLGMAACGMATTLMTPIFMFTSLASWLASNALAIVLAAACLGALVYVGYRAFLWFFYDRHAHLRVGIEAKRKEARSV